MIATKINAPNDGNGNPQRGWMIYDAAGNTIDFVEEGYLGTEALVQAGYGGHVLTPPISVTSGEYNRMRRTFSKRPRDIKIPRGERHTRKTPGWLR